MPKKIDPQLRPAPAGLEDRCADLSGLEASGPHRAERTLTDALVEDKICDFAWTVNQVTGQIQMTPEGLYGRRKWVALLRRQEGLAGTSRGAVDRAMRSLGLEGVRRAKKLRTTVPDPDGKRADDLLNRDFTAPAPNRVWVTDFTYVRTWAGFVYVAFVVDVFAQRIVGWHASTSKKVDLVMTPLRIALWQRERDGNPVCGANARGAHRASGEPLGVRGCVLP